MALALAVLAGQPTLPGQAVERLHHTLQDARPSQVQYCRIDNDVARQLHFQVEELSLDSPPAAMDQDMLQCFA